MKYWILGFFILVGFSANSQNDNEEYIRNFSVLLKLDTTGECTVTETITVNVTGNIIKRGIMRKIPTSRVNTDKTYSNTPIDLISVSHNGMTSDYHTKNESGNLVIYIGSKDVMIPSGLHQYEIVYRTKNQIGFYDQYDELYWNVTGHDWDLPIRQATCFVSLPNAAIISQKACYTGQQGANENNCKLMDESERSVNFSAENLNQNEGLTVAVGFNKGIINPPPPPPPPTWWELWRIRIISMLTLACMIFYYGYTWMKFGVDPQKPVVYPRFEPPRGLSLSEIGMIHNENFSFRFISATLLQWAVKGFITIKDETESYLFNLIKSPKFVLTKIKPPDESFSETEKVLFEDLFGSKDKFTIDGEYNEDIHTATTNFSTKTKNNYDTTHGKGKNRGYVIIASLVFVAALVLMVALDKEALIIFFVAPLFIIVLIVPFLFGLMGRIFNGLNIKLYNDIIIWLILIPSTIVVAFIWGISVSINEKIFLSFLATGVASLLLYSYLIKRPSAEKLAIQSEIEGFKMYLDMAENERVKLLNPPDETPQLFEKYLPYAALFKVEKVWGERFKNILEQTPQQQNTYAAGWYSGGNFSQFTSSFSSAGFSQAMNSSSTPSSSYSSGSGGGGFSGGGGGGGGGGGW